MYRCGPPGDDDQSLTGAGPEATVIPRSTCARRRFDRSASTTDHGAWPPFRRSRVFAAATQRQRSRSAITDSPGAGKCGLRTVATIPAHNTSAVGWTPKELVSQEEPFLPSARRGSLSFLLSASEGFFLGRWPRRCQMREKTGIRPASRGPGALRSKIMRYPMFREAPFPKRVR